MQQIGVEALQRTGSPNQPFDELRFLGMHRNTLQAKAYPEVHGFPQRII